MNLILISYAKQALKQGSREQLRMEAYARELDSLVLVVATRKSDQLPTVYNKGNLTVYGTNTRTRLGVFVRALMIALRAARTQKEVTVSAQDPFQMGVIAYVVSTLTGARLHMQLHEDPLMTIGTTKLSLTKRVRLQVMLFMLMRAAKVRVVSRRVATYLAGHGIPAEKITVLPIQPDLQRFIEVGTGRVESVGETCTFLYVGRFVAGKHLDVFVRAFAQVYATHTHVRLRLVGDGPEKDSVTELIDRLGLTQVVSLVSWTDDVAGEMSHADVFVFASSYEGYGLVLVEAMAAGLAIITTDVGCVGELITDGEEALVVSGTDAAFAVAMTELADSRTLRAALAAKGQTRVARLRADEASYVQQWRDSF